MEKRQDSDSVAFLYRLESPRQLSRYPLEYKQPTDITQDVEQNPCLYLVASACWNNRVKCTLCPVNRMSNRWCTVRRPEDYIRIEFDSQSSFHECFVYRQTLLSSISLNNRTWNLCCEIWGGLRSYGILDFGFFSKVMSNIYGCNLSVQIKIVERKQNTDRHRRRQKYLLMNLIPNKDR